MFLTASTTRDKQWPQQLKTHHKQWSKQQVRHEQLQQ